MLTIVTIVIKHVMVIKLYNCYNLCRSVITSISFIILDIQTIKNNNAVKLL